MATIVQLLGISTELLLIFAFLPFSYVKKNGLILLPVHVVAIVLVTLAEPQSSFYEIVGIVALRLAIFTAFIFCYYEFPVKHCISLAMTYFLLTQPARRVVAAAASYYTLHALGSKGQLLCSLVNTSMIRSPLIFLIQLLILMAVRRRNPELETVIQNPLAKAQNILLLGLYLYVRYNEKYWGFSVESRLFDLFMILIVYAAIILSTILTVHMLILQQREQFQREIFLNSQRQYQAVMEQMRSDSSIRRIYHDLQKHIDALSTMMDNQEEFQQYLKSMTQTVDEQLPIVDTGDTMLDAVLAQKLRDATAENVCINICVDFRQGGFVAPIDKVAIFSNILDNAIEAVCRVSEPAKRRIILKCDAQRGALLIRSSNYFTGKLLSNGENFISTKADPAMHGIGISSVRHSVGKYGGTVDISTDADRFTISILIPLPTE